MKTKFEWDFEKNQLNIKKHQVSFEQAHMAFLDTKRLIFKDTEHSTLKEIRYYCLGKINNEVCTVRFTYRNNVIRIFGAGYWRKEKRIYEKINQE